MGPYVVSEASDVGGLDSKLIATMRLVLSSSVLFIIAPTDLEDFNAFHILSVLYTTYSAILYGFARRGVQSVLSKMLCWADFIWAVRLGPPYWRRRSEGNGLRRIWTAARSY